MCTTFLLWDRHSLVIRQEETVRNLTEENERLEHSLQKISILLKTKGETIPQELEFLKHEKSGTKVSGQSNTKGFFQRLLPDKRKPPVSDTDEDPVMAERREKVKAAMLHAWTCYEKYAWGMDELKPQSKTGENSFAGLGATIIDSLDTLYIMGLKKEYNKARDWVAENLDFNKDVHTSVFETTIRVLGGLLSAYDLSGEPMFLKKAQQITDRLLPAWNTPSGIPYGSINLATGDSNSPGWSGGNSILADLGTEQMEFIALTQRTNISKYKEKAERVIIQLKKVFPSDGLLPYYISPDSGQIDHGGKVTFGAMGDSFYEYLLKVWVLGNKTEVVKHYREMWEQSMEGMKSLVKKSSDGYTYLAERAGNQMIDKMDELACFVPGMLVLGTDGATPQKADEYLNLAQELAKTCYNMYRMTNSKLAGENYNFNNRMQVGTSWNIMRPETVESFMYLWRKTGDQKYRDWGWDIFQAFETQTKLPTGYTGLRDVNTGEKDDKMQTFFLAETLKYLYLLFSPSTVIPLDEWVFNTEAHPMRITPRVDEPIALEDQPVIIETTKASQLRQEYRQHLKGRRRGIDQRVN